MRRKFRKSAKRTAKEILDSDDELPFDYIEIPFVPAYLMDNRFDHIEKENENKAKTEVVDEEKTESDKETTEETDKETTEETDQDTTEEGNNQYRTQQQKKEGLSNKTTVVGSRYLNEKDTFCFQCLEPYTGKNTQQWFFNFLIVKDLNASYTFLTTCLVPRYGMATLRK